jgi:hypothetical protein
MNTTPSVILPPAPRAPTPPANIAGSINRTGDNDNNAMPTTKSAVSLDDFVGNQIRFPLINSPATTDAELERRKGWLPQFLAQGGLSKLISLLKDLA